MLTPIDPLGDTDTNHRKKRYEKLKMEWLVQERNHDRVCRDKGYPYPKEDFPS